MNLREFILSRFIEERINRATPSAPKDVRRPVDDENEERAK